MRFFRGALQLVVRCPLVRLAGTPYGVNYMRRTVSNLSRQLKISRPAIYRAMKRIGITPRPGGDYTDTEWDSLRTELSKSTRAAEATGKDSIELATLNSRFGKGSGVSGTHKRLSDEESATIQERLSNAKWEYDYNCGLIELFQIEITEFFEKNRRTTAQMNNGVMAPIPAVTSMEKYIKLNISLSRLIDGLESDLDLEVGSGDDVLG